LARLVIAASEVGVDLDLAADEIDDPVERNAALSVSRSLLALVAVKTAVGDLD